MDCVNNVNRLVNVIAYYFKGQLTLECFPKRIEYNNRVVTFNENGRRRNILRNKRLIQVFDMNDDDANYRLAFDSEKLNWQLLSVSSRNYQLPIIAPSSLVSASGRHLAPAS